MYNHEVTRDEITAGNDSLDSVGSYINLSAWKFEANQIAQNKDVENMLKREKKSLTRVTKLVKPVVFIERKIEILIKIEARCCAAIGNIPASVEFY